MTLLDTSVLIRTIDTKSPWLRAARTYIEDSLRDEITLCLVPQVIFEFIAVATRPTSANGLGLLPSAAFQSVDEISKEFKHLADHPLLPEVWRSLVERHDVRGKSVHDARLVAAMRVHDISRIATFNAADFRRYPDIEIVVPGAPTE